VDGSLKQWPVVTAETKGSPVEGACEKTRQNVGREGENSLSGSPLEKNPKMGSVEGSEGGPGRGKIGVWTGVRTWYGVRKMLGRIAGFNRHRTALVVNGRRGKELLNRAEWEVREGSPVYRERGSFTSLSGGWEKKKKRREEKDPFRRKRGGVKKTSRRKKEH